MRAVQVDFPGSFPRGDAYLGQSAVSFDDLGEAGFLGDLIVLLRDGRVVQRGTLADLVRAPAEPFVTQFVNAQRPPLEVLPA